MSLKSEGTLSSDKDGRQGISNEVMKS